MRALISMLLVVALPAWAADVDAGVDAPTLPPAIYAQRASLLVPDAGWVEPEGDGVWSPTPRALHTGKELEQLRAENIELKAMPSGLKPIFTAAWVGFAAGILTSLLGIGAICWAVTGSPICLRR